ncbi:MAG: BON domain-containing protein [Gammaproteobacteria bacterium]
MKRLLILAISLAPLAVLADNATQSAVPKSEPGLFEELGKKLDKASDKMAIELDETATTAKIMGKYSIDKDLGPFKIQAFTKAGHVTLVGEVQTESQYEKAIMHAAATESVNKVDATRLNVVQKQNPLPDVYLTALIKAKLIKTRLFEKEDPTTWPVKIEAKNNVVYLSGTLSGEGQKQHLLEVIHGIEGIDSIKDDIKIEPLKSSE